MCSTLGFYNNNINAYNQNYNNNKNHNNTNNINSTQLGNNLKSSPNNLKVYHSKVSPSRRLKNILKPIIGRVFKSKSKKPKRSSYIASDDQEIEFEWLHNEMDNRANEQLEKELLHELNHCKDGAAIIVYDEVGKRHLEEVDKDDLYVPVHFARTNAGTFFWTSMQRETIEPYRIEWNFMDRWAQA